MIKVFTAFSGYDSQCMALDRLDIDYDLVGWSEIDRYAITAHNIIYPQYEDRNFGDIAKIDWEKVPDFDLFTYSSPCTDFSNAGLQMGGEKGSGTQSSLLWECEKAISIKRPKYLVFENVSNLVSKRFIKTFNEWQYVLERLGYTNFTQVLNAKDYGVPQNRERVFMVSILNCDDVYYFPPKQRLDKALKDVLDSDVDEKYYLSDKIIEGFMLHKEKNNNFIKEPKIIQLANIAEEKNFTNPQNGRIYSIKGIAPTINTMQGGHGEPKIVIGGRRLRDCVDIDKGDCIIDAYNQSYHSEISPTITTRVDASNCIYKQETICINSKVNGKQPSLQDRVYNTNGIATAITTGFHPNIYHKLRIRKLTERECFRLMGVSEENIDKLCAGSISKTQLYKMAGNSIVVDVLLAIFDFLLNKKRSKELRLF